MPSVSYASKEEIAKSFILGSSGGSISIRRLYLLEFSASFAPEIIIAFLYSRDMEGKYFDATYIM